MALLQCYRSLMEKGDAFATRLNNGSRDVDIGFSLVGPLAQTTRFVLRNTVVNYDPRC